MNMETKKNEIVELLVSLGLPRENALETIDKVNAVAFVRAFDAHIEKFPESTREQIKTFSQGQLEEFLRENIATLPKMFAEDITKASEETWSEYFETLSAGLKK